MSVRLRISVRAIHAGCHTGTGTNPDSRFCGNDKSEAIAA
jgi:hypothetical protein